MPNLTDFRKVSRQHLRDAQALYRAKRYKGAAYLCGYAVEIALKVRIAKTLKWGSYPDAQGGTGLYRSFLRHNLDELLELSGRVDEIKTSPALTSHWSHVSNWNPEMRYVLPPPQITANSVKDMLDSAAELLRVFL